MARKTTRAAARTDSKAPLVASASSSRIDAAMARAHRDGWENILTGLGTPRDKRKSVRSVARLMDPLEGRELWRSDDMAGRIVEKPAQEMTRKWIDLAIEDDRETAEIVLAKLDELDAPTRVREAIERERATGGSAILIGAQDGALDLTRPLNLDSIQKVKWLQVYDASEILADSWYEDPRVDEKYGDVKVWSIQSRWVSGPNAGNFKVHESRLLTFPGVVTSREQVVAQNGWGDPVFVRVLEALEDFGQSHSGAAALVTDFSQAVFKVRGLAAALSSPGGKDLMKSRIEMMDLARSLLRAVILDAGDGEGGAAEEFERKSTSVTGLPDLLDRFSKRLAAAADMPLTMLLGESAGGISGEDSSGITWWTEHIEGLQNKKLRKPLNHLVKVLLRSKECAGEEPENWKIIFNPLRQLSQIQKAEMHLKYAQADAALVNAGIVLAEEVAVSRWGGDEFGEAIHLDMKLRKQVEQQQAAEQEAMAAQAAAAAAAGGGAAPGGGKGRGAPPAGGGGPPRAAAPASQPKAPPEDEEEEEPKKKPTAVKDALDLASTPISAGGEPSEGDIAAFMLLNEDVFESPAARVRARRDPETGEWWLSAVVGDVGDRPHTLLMDPTSMSPAEMAAACRRMNEGTAGAP